MRSQIVVDELPVWMKVREVEIDYCGHTGNFQKSIEAVNTLYEGKNTNSPFGTILAKLTITWL